jgi:transposase
MHLRRCGAIDSEIHRKVKDEGYYTPIQQVSEKPLAESVLLDSAGLMIRRGFLDSVSRQDLVELARDGSAPHRLARRANALVLLDDGMSCAAVAKVLLLDDDTIRTWYRLYQDEGVEGLANFGYDGGACRLTDAQQERLKAWVSEALPRTTREVGAWIAQEFGIEYQGRSGLITLLHRLGMEHRKPKAISRKLDPAKQAGFIKRYEQLMNQLEADEAVMFADAVHPTHEARPVGCWAPKQVPIAITPTSGRNRLNIHGAIDLETGNTRMLEVLTVNAISTIMLLMAIEAMYPGKRLIHVFLDNARYHHAKLVKQWLARPECRIKLHFIPAYCPHLDAIERLWALMHRNVTHNKCYPSFREFKAAVLGFLREQVPRNWHRLCDEVTDNFRIIDPAKFRILA